MLKIISVLFDRSLFTILFILGVQFPEFIQQYSQRLSGHLNEALSQLSEHQLVADRHFDGSLKSMVEKYLTNSEPSIKETAVIINNISHRVTDLKSQLFNIQETEYIERLYYFITQFDSSMAEATLKQYQLAIPLNLPALLTGIILALSIILIIYILLSLIKIVFYRVFNKNTNSTLNKKVNYKSKVVAEEDEIEKAIKISPRIGNINNI